MIQRKRKLMAFMVLTMLLYGRHSSVTWHTQTSCTIKTNDLARTLSTTSTKLRQYMEWLHKRGYLSSLSIAHGSISATLVQPLPRGPRE